MVVRGLISFGVGGAFLLLAITEIFGNVQTLFYDPYPLLLQSVLLGFVSFVLIGFGLFLLVKEAKQEKHAQAPPQQ
jgi:large-conductance mechanosensitive channel